MGVDQNCKDFIKGGVAVPYVPKIQALPGWGGSDPCLDFFEIFVHMHLGYHLSPKSDISPQKCSLFPRIHHSTKSILHSHQDFQCWVELVDFWIKSICPDMISIKISSLNLYFLQSGVYGVFTAVSSFREWIDRTLEQNGGARPCS